MVAVYYHPAYAAAAFAFPTTRKARWIAESLQASPLPGIALEEPAALSEPELLAVHDASYVEAIRTGWPRDLAESQELPWCPALWPMVLASSGGAVAAARRALRDGRAGSLSSGLHHAQRGRGHGYCTFNGLVLAAHAALSAGAGNVLILDLDAHCGGGTHSLIADHPRIWQIDVSTDPFDSYRPTARTTLDLVSRASDYLPTIARRLQAATTAFDLCLYNAGMDPHEDSPHGALPGITDSLLQEREEQVFAWCRSQQIPIAFVMAGGYLQPPRLDEERLVKLHRLTLAAAAADLPTGRRR